MRIGRYKTHFLATARPGGDNEGMTGTADFRLAIPLRPAGYAGRVGDCQLAIGRASGKCVWCPQLTPVNPKGNPIIL